jgi:5-formyltetrahydrofolate cyclo-ligase
MLPPQHKQPLRHQLRARRRSLSAWQQQRNARHLADTITRQPGFRRARHIALYLAGDGEIDPALFAQRARQWGKHLYLPVLAADRSLRFVEWRQGAPLRRNRFGIGEPRGKPISWRRLDLVLLPLVGFDPRGGRLGMGGGFYDRTFAQLAGRDPRWRQPQLVGLAHALQQVEALPIEPWDVALAAVATERGWRVSSAGIARCR